MKSFDEIYNEILNDDKSELENLRKKCVLGDLKEIFGVFFSVIVVFFFWLLAFFISIEPIVIFALTIVIFAFIMNTFKNKSKGEYTETYKEKVVKEFIKAYDENLKYVPENGIEERIYKEANFRKGHDTYDRYRTEDLIEGNIDDHNIQLAEVCTILKHENSSSITFHGLFAYIELDKICDVQMTIYSDLGYLMKFINEKSRIENEMNISANSNLKEDYEQLKKLQEIRVNLDSSEFEKNFDVYTDNPIKAMQLLTADIMEKILNFQNESQIVFDININNDKLYIRFHTGEVFEGNIYKSAVNYNTLKQIYDIINFTLDITREFIKVSEETEI